MNKRERLINSLESVKKTILIYKDNISTDYCQITMPKSDFEQMMNKLIGCIAEAKGQVKDDHNV